ncbi:hypothetical protein D3C84_718140 [compost metagenome]
MPGQMQPWSAAGDVAAGQQLVEQADKGRTLQHVAAESTQAVPVRAHLIRFEFMETRELLHQRRFQGFPATGAEQQWALAGFDQAHVSGQHPTAARSVELPLQSLRIEPGVAVGQQCR